jgi:hypothetical protein
MSERPIGTETYDPDGEAFCREAEDVLLEVAHAHGLAVAFPPDLFDGHPAWRRILEGMLGDKWIAIQVWSRKATAAIGQANVWAYAFSQAQGFYSLDADRVISLSTSGPEELRETLEALVKQMRLHPLRELRAVLMGALRSTRDLGRVRALAFDAKKPPGIN